MRNVQFILFVACGFIVTVLIIRVPAVVGPEHEQPQEERLYPYDKTIEKWSQEYGVDPSLVAAVIKNESAFDPERESPEGAVGLMQVLPSTAEKEAEKIGLVEVCTNELFTPETNIRIGTHYLRQLIDLFDADLVAALAAYNAGPNRVKKWQNFTRWQQNTGIERIPLMETRSYVLLVLEDYDIFNSLSD